MQQHRRIPGFGRPVARGPAGGPARIGQVFVTSPGAALYYVLTRQGLAPLTSTEAKLLDAAPGQVPQGTVTTAQAMAGTVARMALARAL